MKNLQSVEDFVSDELFQSWILEGDEEAGLFWKRWLASHPEMQPVVDEAIQMVSRLNFKEDKPEDERFFQVWKRIQAQNQSMAAGQPGKAAHHSHRYAGLQIAAIITLLLAAGTTFWNIWHTSNEYITYATPYGQTRQVMLPDSSMVTLNANSTLRFPAAWHESDVREVWLEGEAFFNVTRKASERSPQPYTKFLVHTHDLNVEVRGTAFNVNTRRKKNRVVLNHGLVHINFNNWNNQKNLVMQPGDMVEFSESEQTMAHKKVDTLAYTSWIQEKLIFKNKTLEEIVNVLEDNYGYHITFGDSHIARERFTVSIPTDDVELLFPMLSRSFNLDMEKKQKRIVFSKK